MASLVRLHLAFDRYSDVLASQVSVRRFPTKIWTAFDGSCLSVTLTLLFRFENPHLLLLLESDGRFAMWLKGCCAIWLLSAFVVNLPFLEYSGRDLAVGDIELWYVVCLYMRISSTQSIFFIYLFIYFLFLFFIRRDFLLLD